MGYRVFVVVFLTAFVTAGCAGPAPAARSNDSPVQQSAPPRKRISAAIFGLGYTFSTLLAVGGTGNAVPGTSEMELLVNSGLTVVNANGVREAKIAHTVPTTENGLWKINPDGTMETTYRLRTDVFWHDGTPFTADDLLFTAQVIEDRTLSLVRRELFAYVDQINAPDPSTVVVSWKQPFIDADMIFSTTGTLPLPRQILAQQLDNKDAFSSLPYFSREFVGVGPYQVKEWVEGSHTVLEANPRFFLGQPAIDEIEVKFIPSPTTMLANLLAGSVELTMGRGFSLELGQELQRLWHDGRVEAALGGPLSLRPQHLNPNPAILADPSSRKALYHAINRQAMVDSLMGGFSFVAHGPVGPRDALLQDAAKQAVHYDYEPRRAVEILEGMGLTRGADGRWLDRAGQRITLELRRAGDDDIEEKTILAAADNWTQLGFTTEPVQVPPARQRDLEYRAKFPGFEISGSGSSLGDIRYIRESELRNERNGYNGRNRTGFFSPELTALEDRYLVTVPVADRNQVLGEILKYLTERVIIMYQFYDSAPNAITNRLVGVDGKPQDTQISWNAHTWDVK
jgi:peptide/nickel transport system substrate-binding protein